jgi:DNA-binding NarL/FixJ family response regulator
MTIRILIVEDHPVTRLGLRIVIEEQDDMTVVGEAGDGVEAMRLVAALNPDVVLMDLGLPKIDGFECSGLIKAGSLRARVLVRSSHEEDTVVIGALAGGVDGYCFKDTSDSILFDGIRTVMSGRAWYDPRIPGHLHKYHNFQP